MVRVGSLYDLDYISPNDMDKKSGLTPAQQLKEIYKVVNPLYAKKEIVYQQVQQQLLQHHIGHLTWEKLSDKQKKKQNLPLIV